mgnify:CR=1 FL=1
MPMSDGEKAIIKAIEKLAGSKSGASSTATVGEEEDLGQAQTRWAAELQEIKDVQKSYEDLGKSQQARSLQQAEAVRLKQKEFDIAKETIRLGISQGPEDIKRLENAKKELKKAEEKLKVINKTNVAFTEGVDAARDLGKSLGSALGPYGSHPVFNVANLGKVAKAFRGGGNAVRAFGFNLVKAGIGAFINSMIKLVFIMNESESAFRKATGGNKSLAREMTNGYERTRKYTVSVQENQEAWTKLHGTFTDFTMASAATRADLADNVAIMSRLGVSADVSSKAMQTLTISFGDTAETASRSLLELRAAAVDLGVAPAMLIEQFGSMGNRLAKMGSQGVDAFKDLARISKITGMELGKLIALTEKFDTFEGAAERAGMLNAALGGNFVNAMDLMMETDPAARFEMIRDAIKDTGLTFDDMSYYQRKFYTEAAGLEEVSDLAALMRGDMDALSGGLNQTSADYAQAAEEARNMATFQERIQALFMRLIPVLTPVIDAIDELIQYFEGTIKSTDDLHPKIVSFIGIMESLGSKIMFVGKHWKWFLALWAGFKLLPLLGGLAKLTKLGFIGPAAAPAAGPMLALGAAALMVGAGVGLAALGLAQLVKSFKGMEWDEFQMMALGITILSGALWLLVGALAGMANPLSWVGVAAIGAVGLAAGGISKLIGVFKKDKDNMEDMGAVFDSYGEVNTEQLEAGMAAFESMKDSINEMSGKKLGALAILAPAMAISAMVSPRSTPTPAAGGQSGTQRIRNEITITLEGRQLQSFVEETVGAVVGNAALGNG